jgi:hypothetical protein
MRVLEGEAFGSRRYEGTRRTRSTKSAKEGRSATDSFVLRALRPLRVFVVQTPFGAS